MESPATHISKNCLNNEEVNIFENKDETIVFNKLTKCDTESKDFKPEVSFFIFYHNLTLTLYIFRFLIYQFLSMIVQNNHYLQVFQKIKIKECSIQNCTNISIGLSIQL